MSESGTDKDLRDYPQVGVGWAFPVRWDEGRLDRSAGEPRIVESLLLIVRTAIGSRTMRHDFGCGADELVFESVESGSLVRLETEVRRALLIGEPRVLVDDVAVEDASADGMVRVTIEYRIDRHRRPNSLVIDFERAGAIA